MKFEWNPEKNEWLKKERKISFEQIVFHLSRGDLWKVAGHPNQEKYPGQRIFFIVADDYVFMVPHVMQKEIIFLKTIIPSRNATKAFQLEKEENEIRR